MILPSSSMKHPRWVNQTCIPWSTICPTDTKFLVIVGTCKTLRIIPFWPTCLRGTSPMCSMGRGVIAGLDEPWQLLLLKSWEPFFMVRWSLWRLACGSYIPAQPDSNKEQWWERGSTLDYKTEQNTKTLFQNITLYLHTSVLNEHFYTSP